MPETREKIKEYCEEAVFYDTVPESDAEITERIGDADGIFVSYTHKIGENVLKDCKDVRYIGMCCSLYSEASSNVDLAYARAAELR